jgi:DNA (cytosine-5)-methyltransferase 1
LTAYYNENDPFAAAWLRELIKAGLIAPGEVDERSIEDVFPDDLKGFTQCHFFAGIGVWSYALRCAGWSDARPIWTGSCPCQPFSTAGKGKGIADERHLWPAFFHLIEQCSPSVVFGEQVAGKDGLAWLDLISADMEGMGYAFGAVPMAAAGFGAPHIRERLYWVADADRARFQGGAVKALPREGRREEGHEAGRGGARLVDGDQRPGPADGFWRDADWIGCTDGKWRPVEPGSFPLVNGAVNRVGRLRGYGNAIVAPQAQAFIEAVMACRD